MCQSSSSHKLAHLVQLMQQFLAKRDILQVHQPPYFQNMVCSDFTPPEQQLLER
jgi:hypothetical protein